MFEKFSAIGAIFAATDSVCTLQVGSNTFPVVFLEIKADMLILNSLYADAGAKSG